VGVQGEIDRRLDVNNNGRLETGPPNGANGLPISNWDDDDLSLFTREMWDHFYWRYLNGQTPDDGLPLFDGTGTGIDGISRGKLSREDIDNRIGAAGMWWDPHLGIYHVRHRAYDPRLGRFLQPDPIGVAGGWNVFEYVGGDPANRIDPTGLWWWDGDWIQYGVGGLVGFHGSEPVIEGAKGAHDGFVVTTNSAANALTYGAVGSSLEELKDQGVLYDGNDGTLVVSEVAGSVAGELGQAALLGGIGKLGNCNSIIGNSAKVLLHADAAYQVTSTAYNAAGAMAEMADLIAKGDYEGAAVAGGKVLAHVVASVAMAKVQSKLADGIVCFAEGTPVRTPTGLRPIESFRVGERIWTSGTDTTPDTPIDPAEWRLYTLELVGDPTRQGILEILRPAEWQTSTTTDGDSYWLWLEIPEWGVSGYARLLNVAPCPPIEPGPGRIVLMRSATRYVGEMATLKLAGVADIITGTADHPIFSEDRGEYVPLGDLTPGERVRTADGWAIVESLARCRGQQEVYNLEVDAEHRYFVGSNGVEGHNADACGGGRSGRQKRLEEIGNDPNSPSSVRGWIAQERKAIERGNRDAIRVPPGKVLAHERGREAAKGYSYLHSHLQDIGLHRTQHLLDRNGTLNRERPISCENK
jgi:RHS repeat-associated protein